MLATRYSLLATAASLILLVEGGVEREGAAGEIEFAQERRGLRGAVDAVHADVLPFNGEWSAVANVVQCDNDFFEVDVSAADRAEIPLTAGIAERGVSTENADRAIAMTPPNVLHVRVEDAAGESADELHVVDTLIPE